MQALAAAPLDDVLKAWEGLGYYSRARNFHRAVQEVASRHGGRVPGEPGAFRALPGVGRYTAGAVMSIAFGRAEPVVDGNVRRVFARWTDDPAPAEDALWRMAAALVPGERPGDVNQAVMELGATVCTPRNPRCGDCPVRDLCAAYAAGTQNERPAPKKAKPLPHEDTAVPVIQRGGEVLLVRRPVAARLGRDVGLSAGHPPRRRIRLRRRGARRAAKGWMSSSAQASRSPRSITPSPTSAPPTTPSAAPSSPASRAPSVTTTSPGCRGSASATTRSPSRRSASPRWRPRTRGALTRSLRLAPSPASGRGYERRTGRRDVPDLAVPVHAPDCRDAQAPPVREVEAPFGERERAETGLIAFPAAGFSP